MIDRLIQLFGSRGRRVAAEVDVLRPLVQQARDFFGAAVASGGADSSEFIQVWGEIERRLQEVVVADKKLDELLGQMRSCANSAWARSPAPTAYVVSPDNPVVPAHVRDAQKRKGEVVEICRECEGLAIEALRRMSKLRASAQQ